MRDLTAGKLTPKLSDRIADVRGRQWPTHRSRWCIRNAGGKADTAERIKATIIWVRDSCNELLDTTYSRFGIDVDLAGNDVQASRLLGKFAVERQTLHLHRR